MNRIDVLKIRAQAIASALIVTLSMLASINGLAVHEASMAMAQSSAEQQA